MYCRESMTAQHWTLDESRSLADTRHSLKVVDGLLSFMSGGVGKPSNNERSLFAATVIFAYGVWESYAEQLAIELVTRLSAEIEPSNVPQCVHAMLEKKADSTWALAISPGWRALWVAEVTRSALGDDKSFGLNTASEGKVTALFETVGIEQPLSRLPKTLIPDHLKGEANVPIDALDRLIPRSRPHVRTEGSAGGDHRHLGP